MAGYSYYNKEGKKVSGRAADNHWLTINNFKRLADAINYFVKQTEKQVMEEEVEPRVKEAVEIIVKRLMEKFTENLERNLEQNLYAYSEDDDI